MGIAIAFGRQKLKLGSAGKTDVIVHTSVLLGSLFAVTFYITHRIFFDREK
jgi:hypothetical protein